jgi:hypothetical protein
MKRLLTLLALTTLSITACQPSPVETPLPDVGGTVTAPAIDEQIIDSSAWEIEESTARGDRYVNTVINPTSGAELMSYLILPEGADQAPVVILIPGGVGSGSTDFLNDIEMVNFFLENEIAVAFFDPDGRGMSTGKEDTNGHTAQDGLYAVTESLIDSGLVDSEEMGIISYSFGVTLASGMLARYADTQPYEWFIDWEGPTSREFTTVGCDPDSPDSPSDAGLSRKCKDDEHWEEREAATYLSDILVPYWRIQGERDHVQPDNGHAIEAINAATNGLSPWTKINNEDPNQTFSMEDEPEYLGNNSRIMTLHSAVELFSTY